MKQLSSIIAKETGTKCLINSRAYRLQIQTMNCIRIQSINVLAERKTSVNFEPSNWPGLNVLGKLSH